MSDPTDFIPSDQQEDESDLVGPVSFKDAVVMNADWTIETIVLQIRKGNIDVQPGFQRRVAWDDVRKSRLIESIIIGMPVPNIVLAENREHRGRFIVIDGKQRLMSISEFVSGDFRLKGLDIRPDLNGLGMNDLPPADREYLENSTLRSTVIRNWNDDKFLYAIFYRLNSGSLQLSPQELRKALVGGNLISAIDEYLIGSAAFKKMFGEGLDKRMRDSELVLRFLAFDRDLESYRGNFKQFLDDTTRYYEDDWSAREQEAAKGFERLDCSLEVTYRLFGDHAFKKWIGDKYERVINRALFDCVARFFADREVGDRAQAEADRVVAAFKEICGQTAFREAIERTTKSTQATFYRVGKWGETLSDTIGMDYDKTAHRII